MTASTSVKRLALVLNQKGAGREDVGAAIAALRARGHELRVGVTHRDGSARVLAERFIAAGVRGEIDTVVACGGDGTVDAVLGAALDAAHDAPDAVLPTFGVLPLGTANDFAHAADLPIGDPLAALELIVARAPRWIDLGVLEERAFVNMATGGFGARVTVETESELKQRFGGLAYILSGLARAGELRSFSGTFTGEDFSWSGQFVALAIGNGRLAGGGLALHPDALLDDGLLDLTIIRDVTRDLSIGALAERLTGGEGFEPVRIGARGPWFRYEGEDALPINLDGEPQEMTRFSARVAPRALRVHLGPAAPLAPGSTL